MQTSAPPSTADAGQQQLAELLEVIRRQMPGMDTGLIERAYQFAARAHEGQFRKSGEPYIYHPIATARILAEMQLDQETIAAALLHDTIEDTGATEQELAREFGGRVAKLVNGVTKLGRTASMHWRHQEDPQRREREKAEQAENLRKMVLAMVDDVSVVLIKLADRLHNMRSAPLADAEKQRRKALETMEIYAPLANRLGIRQFKWELEDLAFKYLSPERYREIEQKLAAVGEERERYIEQVTAQLRQALDSAGVAAEISGRWKHIYSIAKKMERKERSFDEIYDVVGVRVIVDEKRDCYGALGVIHEMWHPIPGEFDDYIATPKESMYQSLHTAVLALGARPLEIQIRTWEMHRVAEYGIAAHWRYKEEGRSDAGVEAKVAWLRQLMEWRDEVVDAQEFVESLKSDVFREMIYVFTPAGDIIALPKGATPVDFAYRIHTDVGHSCIGAKVNDKLVPLNYQLENGQVVRITTSKAKVGPSRDWLNPAAGYVTTAGAREKVRQWFRRQQRDENIAQGKETLEKELKRLGLTLKIEEVARHFPTYPKSDDFLAAIGYGAVTAQQIAARLGEAQERTVILPQEYTPTRPSPSNLEVMGVGDLLTRLAACCKPVPGDAIVGYVTRGKGITVHRADCPNVANVAEAERLVPVSWGDGKRQLYPVQVRLSAWDRVGLLRDITTVAADEKVNLLSVLTNTYPDRSVTILMTIEVSGVRQLSHILSRFENIRDVYEVMREGRDGAAGPDGGPPRADGR
ncbi:MAG TPA: bifunctional (p)ppGpp synthetase/guanosine-3',5'-bis(diphosphate) 3'-pyrophosphohydrolase [Thermomicrobiales bacterium]|nr:bifunctional (p)ppGpp synthetase/guanosine-3',5'-bis(diphosphate) 3'-pyrophosphohydrolase [Thermomicrobiales bacterium]